MSQPANHRRSNLPSLPRLSNSNSRRVFYRPSNRALELDSDRVFDPDIDEQFSLIRFECIDGYSLALPRDLIAAVSEKIANKLADDSDGLQQGGTMFKLPARFTRKHLKAVYILLNHGMIVVNSGDVDKFEDLANILGINLFDQPPQLDRMQPQQSTEETGENRSRSRLLSASSNSSSSSDHSWKRVKIKGEPNSDSDCKPPRRGRKKKRQRGRPVFKPPVGQPDITNDFLVKISGLDKKRWLCRECQRHFAAKQTLSTHYVKEHPGKYPIVTVEIID